MKLTHKECPYCHRVFKVNRNGTIRSHWCKLEVGSSKTITFATGGTLSLRLEANWMAFGDAERALLYAMIDAMDEYERQHPQNERTGDADLPDTPPAADPASLEDQPR
jgi:hypothetical protein